MRRGQDRNNKETNTTKPYPPLPHTYREKRLGGQVRVVALSLRLGGPQHLQPHELEALVLEAGDDGCDEATLHAIGLDGNEGALLQKKRG
jgi:hypothetical protein